MKPLPEHGSCFVCGKENEHSIGVKWYIKENKSIWGAVTLSERQQGPPQLAHGGATAALLDEAMGVAVWQGGYKVVAIKLNVDFKRPVPLGVEIQVSGRIVAENKKEIHTSGEITLPDGTVAVIGNGVFVEAPQLFE